MIAILSFLVALFVSDASAAKDFCQPNASYEATVAAITDGDTIKANEKESGLAVKVRMLNIDAPETHFQGQSQEPWGQMAAEHLEKLIPIGSRVVIKTDIEACDAYGRLLGTVFYRNESVNQKMVEDGYAFPYVIYPNIKNYIEILYSGEMASNKGLVVYSENGPDIPFVFRRKVQGTKPNRYVGDISRRCYVAPENWEGVPIYRSVFFTSPSEAKNLGMTRCSN